MPNKLLPGGARHTLTLMVLEEEAGTAIQCLEKDICAQGKTLGAALESWRKSYMGEIVIKNIDKIPPAPAEYWQSVARRSPESPWIGECATFAEWLGEQVNQGYLYGSAHQELRDRLSTILSKRPPLPEVKEEK